MLIKYIVFMPRCKGILLSLFLWSRSWRYTPSECSVCWNRVSAAELLLQFSIHLLLWSLSRCWSEMPR